MKYLAAIFVLIFVSCGIPDKSNPYVSYLQIDNMDLSTVADEGEPTSDFKDAWVFLNGQIIGVYELPRRIPMISEDESGNFNINIQAGIRENGINSQTVVYPFTNNYNIDINLNEDEVQEITPVFEYLDNVSFRLIAEFESGNEFGFDEDGDSTTVFITTDEESASGLRSGKMNLSQGEVMEQASTQVYRNLPADGSPIFIEIEYKGDRELLVGLIGIQGAEAFKEYFVSLRSELVWKKAYINVTDLIVNSDLDGYQIVLGVDNTNGTDEVNVYVDNIKLLHFNR